VQDTSEQRIAAVRGRLQRSRVELFELAQRLKADEPAVADHNEPMGSRIVRALTGERGRMVLTGAGIVLGILRPGMLWRFGRLTRVLQPFVMRYLLPKLLRAVSTHL